MAWKTEPSPDPHALCILCTGNFTPEDLTMLAIEASFLVRKHGHTKVLVDLSEASLGFPAFHLSTLLDIYAEYHLPLDMRSGIVLGEKNASRDLSKLLTTAKEYGYRVDVLADARQAEAWLGETG